MLLHPLQAEWDAELVGDDPLRFPGYTPPNPESVITGRTERYALIAGRFDVLGGSMGAVHGERVARAYRRARAEGLPVVVTTASGGARMQEGMVSLIQMARTAAAAGDHGRAGLLQLAVFGSPTSGGVYASYASLTDARAAVAGATIGFAGPRVVEQTLGVTLPPGSHTAEFAHRSGLVDAVVSEGEAAAWVETALGLRPAPLVIDRNLVAASQVAEEARPAWSEVVLARSPERPSGLDWAARLCTSWTELQGTDPVTRAGLTSLDGDRVVVIAHDRHAATGRPGPQGFALARRAIELAGKLGLPLLTLVDTPGADPGPDAEAGGIAREIARTLGAMDATPVPTVSVCVGEGGSGGALALAHADRLLIQRHAVFSVIGPEGAAAILERDAAKAPEVAEHLRLTAPELLRLGIVDEVVPEDDGAEEAMAGAVRQALTSAEPGQRRRRPDAATARWVR